MPSRITTTPTGALSTDPLSSLGPPTLARTRATPQATAQPSTAVATLGRSSRAGEDAPTLEGDWQPFGLRVAGQSVLARTSVKPDSARDYAQVALVRIALEHAQLHLVPGSEEPVAAKGVRSFPRPGAIPREDQDPDHLLAAFGGGFQSVHGNYGMMVAGITIVPPRDGIATLGLYSDGGVQIVAWGRGITPTTALLAYRQNCPLLLENGQISPAVSNANRKDWGLTIGNLDTTWRSGLGITSDGRFLLYAVGNALTVETLARALQRAGAAEAMQLDINSFNTRFAVFQPANPGARFPVIADKLLEQMPGGPTQFLSPYSHDFVYITLKPNVSSELLPGGG